MFSLLTPVWLAAAAAVVVPLAIHLLSRGSARRIRVGSVRLVESRPTRRTRRLRFRRPWLFLLRAAILSLAALALAAPRAAVPAGGAPWVLVSPELMAQRERLEAANAELYAELDRLRGVAQLRLLAPGLPRRGGPGVAHEPWAMLLEADAAAPPSAVFHVFAPRRSALYPGERPRLAREVRWWAASDPAANRWIERALVSEAALGVTVGESGPDRTLFRRLTGPVEGPPAELELLGGSPPELLLREGGGVAEDDRVGAPSVRPVPVEIVFASERAADAGYLRAALAAVAETTGLALALRDRPLAGDGEAGERPDAALAFRLSPEPLPSGALERLRAGGILVTDAGGRYAAAGVRLAPPDLPHDGEIEISRLAEGEPGRPGAVLWRAATGQTVLVGERVGEGLWLRLRTRLHPEWTDFVLRPELAAWVRELLLRAAPGAAGLSGRTAASDRRETAAALLVPSTGVGGPSRAGAPVRLWPEAVLWVAVALLLPAERLVALGGRR